MHADLSGKKFGKLTVIGFSHERRDNSNNRQFYWNCLCDCGAEKIARESDLLYGRNKSCGCLKRGKSLTGMRFSRLLVIKEADPIRRKDGTGVKRTWLCKCDCGNEKIVLQEYLVSGTTKSCGCYTKEYSKIKYAGYTSIVTENKRLNKIWHSMRSRCKNKSDQHHKNYYDRGIQVCKEWDESFESFCKWALSHGYEENLTIDRIDVNGNYEPSNCRWITMEKQQGNKTNTLRYKVFGETLTVKEISEKYKIKPVTFIARVKRYGYTPEQAATCKLRKRPT